MLRTLMVPRAPTQPVEVPDTAATTGREAGHVQGRPHRIGEARRLKGVVDIDTQHIPNCAAGEI